VPDIMRAALSGTEVRIRNPASVRPWQHVLNPLSGYLILAQRLWASQEHARAWNFGPTDKDARSVGWIVERIGHLWPGGVDYVLDDAPNPPETRYLKLDSSRAREHLGWRPIVELETALEETVSWYRQLSAGADMSDATLDQIGTLCPPA
jgi:CDP-glucose 4,6-dehydratase